MNKVIYTVLDKCFFQIWTSLMEIDGETIFWQRSTHKYPHFLIRSYQNTPVYELGSGTCDLIIAFERDRTNADFRFNSLFFD